MASEEPRAVDDVRPSLADQLDELRELLRRVFEVRVLDDHEVAVDHLEAAAQGGALPHVPRLQQQREAELALQAAEDVARAVRRAVVDDDQLRPQRHRMHAADDLLDRLLLVERRHDDGQQRIGEHAAEARHQRAGPAKPPGCAECHRHASSTIVSSAGRAGTQPSSSRMRSARGVQHRRVTGASRRRSRASRDGRSRARRRR